MSRILRLARTTLLLLALPACGAGLSGTWADETGAGRLEFQEDGTAYLTTFAGTIACTYELDGEHVILKGPAGSQVLIRRGDRLDGGLGASYVKR